MAFDIQKTSASDMENFLFNIFYQSLLEILGKEKVDFVFNKKGMDVNGIQNKDSSKPFLSIIDEIGSLLSSEFGEPTGQGLLIRAGRASLVFFRRYYRAVSELGLIENRLKPVNSRFHYSLEKLADLLASELGVQIRIEQVSTQQFLWKMDLAGTSDDNEQFNPFFVFGLLEEFCYWLDARKNYQLSYLTSGVGEMAEIGISIQPQE